jgi:hypothetical protein
MSARRIDYAIAAAVAMLWTTPFWFTPTFCLDDAYIHLAYAHSLRLGDGLSYNPGDWETGLTSPLWVLLLSLWPPGTPGVLVVKTLGVLLHGLAAACVVGLARALDPAESTGGTTEPALRGSWPLLAGLLCGATPLWVQGATSGMETSLAACLVIGATWAALRDRGDLALGLAALAQLTRPECLVYFLLLSAGLWTLVGGRRALGPAVGAALGFVAFGLYALTVSDYPFPNTYYVKGDVMALESLRYLFVEVTPVQPVVLSLTGLFLLGFSIREQRRTGNTIAAVVLVAGLGAAAAIALSRTLYDGVQFYQSRYFAPFAWVLPLVAAHGVAGMPRGRAVWWCLPLFAASAFLVWANVDLQRGQERGVQRLHVDAAHHMRAELPPDAVIGVEGAGAFRLLTPRSMTVVDLMGLNDGAVAHGPDGLMHKLCHLRRRGGTHVAYPAQWKQTLTAAFELEELKRFTEPRYTQLLPARAWQTTLARVIADRPEFARFCEGP